MNIHQFYMGKAVGFVIVLVLVVVGYFLYSLWLPDEIVAPTPQQDELVGTVWEWEYTLLNDGTRQIPTKAGSFSFTLGDDGRFATETDCNAMSGSYAIGPQGLTFNQIVSTKMFCDGSQEVEFANSLQNAAGHHMGPTGELILDLKFDSGSAIFRAQGSNPLYDPRLGEYQESPVTNGLKSYSSEAFGISFKYPASDVLYEMDSSLLIANEAQILEAIGREFPSEWPASMHVVFTHEPTLKVANIVPKDYLHNWIKTKQQSNFGLSNGKATDTTVAGRPAVAYHVSGLYESEYVVFLNGEWVVMMIADDRGAATDSDFKTVLDSITLEN